MLEYGEKIFKNYVNGEWVRSSSGELFSNTNPALTSEVVGKFQSSNNEDAKIAVEHASAAFEKWRSEPLSYRAEILFKASELLLSRVDQIAEELTREEGKLLSKAKGEVLRASETLRFYAVEGQTLTGETFSQDDPAMRVFSELEPLGVVTVISPWNFPISIPSRKIAPALITGNTVVFKPSTETPLSGYRLVEALADAGIPPGVLNFVTGRASRIGDVLIQAPQVKALTFTGSTQAGESIHGKAGMTTRLQMELGGKNPLVVMPDADLDLAVDLTIKGGILLTGQACTGTGRVLVDRRVRSEYTQKLLTRVKDVRVGNGLDSEVDIGPLATASQLESVLDYIEIGKQEATHLVGGDRINSHGLNNGHFVSPAVFADVTADARIAREEIFGPVIPIIEFDGYEHAVSIANDTEFGLSAAIVTNNPKHAHRFMHDIQSGTVKVNKTTTGNLVNAPFGGMKRSSTGTFRESGRVGLEFFLQTKMCYNAI